MIALKRIRLLSINQLLIFCFYRRYPRLNFKITMKFRKKALFSSRGSVAKTIKADMFLMTPYTLDSSSIIDAKSY